MEEEKWRTNLVILLKHLEKSYPNLSKIHEFRRSVDSCNQKKAEKLLPQLEQIYNQAKEHFDDHAFASWANQQNWTLQLGLKNISLIDKVNPEGFSKHLKWTLSHFDQSLDEGNPANLQKTQGTGAHLSGLPISSKKMKMAMKKVQGMETKQLSTMMKKVPTNQLEALAENPGAEEFVNKLKEDPRAKAVANKIKAAQKM